MTAQAQQEVVKALIAQVLKVILLLPAHQEAHWGHRCRLFAQLASKLLSMRGCDKARATRKQHMRRRQSHLLTEGLGRPQQDLSQLLSL